MQLLLGGKTYEVETIIAAVAKVKEVASRVPLSVFYRNYPIKGAELYDNNGLLGRISYNGRFWPAR